MATKEHKVSQIGPSEGNEREYLEWLIRDYKCITRTRLGDLKRRSRFSKEDRGLLRDWMALAARVIVRHNEKPPSDFNMAA